MAAGRATSPLTKPTRLNGNCLGPHAVVEAVAHDHAGPPGARALAVAGEVGGVALAIDAKDDRAAAWYERFGALRLLDDRLKLVLPLDVIAAALNK